MILLQEKKKIVKKILLFNFEQNLIITSFSYFLKKFLKFNPIQYLWQN